MQQESGGRLPSGKKQLEGKINNNNHRNDNKTV